MVVSFSPFGLPSWQAGRPALCWPWGPHPCRFFPLLHLHKETKAWLCMPQCAYRCFSFPASCSAACWVCLAGGTKCVGFKHTINLFYFTDIKYPYNHFSKQKVSSKYENSTVHVAENQEREAPAMRSASPSLVCISIWIVWYRRWIPAPPRRRPPARKA